MAGNVDNVREVLKAFENGPITLEDLAVTVGSPIEDIERHVEFLRGMGFEITIESNGTARIVSVPDYGLGVAYELRAPFRVEYHETITSTNKRARELAVDGSTDVVIIADEQTGGRGRRDRTWASPRGGIYLSIAFHPEVLPSQTPLFNLAGAVATVRAIRECGVNAGIKWPNDVLVGSSEEKLAGILMETGATREQVRWGVVGIGINANINATELPQGATSLRIISGDDVNRRILTQRILEEFHDLRGNPHEIYHTWKESAVTLGQNVRITLTDSDDTIVGKAVDIDDTGALLVESNNTVLRITNGDCDHLRTM